METQNARLENSCLLIIEEYFKKEYTGMVSFSYYLLKNKSLAEVAVQDSFVFALEHTEKLTSSQNPEGWLYCVLKNTVRHMLRDQVALKNHLVSFEDITEPCTEDRYSDWKTIFDKCSNSDKQLLIRFYIEGYSLRELSNEYNISIGACKMRLKRARNQIKKNSGL